MNFHLLESCFGTSKPSRSARASRVATVRPSAVKMALARLVGLAGVGVCLATHGAASGEAAAANLVPTNTPALADLPM